MDATVDARSLVALMRGNRMEMMLTDAHTSDYGSCVNHVWLSRHAAHR